MVGIRELQAVVYGAFTDSVGRVGVIVVDRVELAAILEVGVGRQVHTFLVEIDDEVVVCGGDLQPQSARAVAGNRQRGRALPQTLVLAYSGDAFLVLALGSELAIETGLYKHAVMW